jgi:hypothetical protein
MSDALTQLAEVARGLAARQVIPFIGSSVLDLVEGDCPVPRSPSELVARMTVKAAVPGRIRNSLTASAQFIESRRHRKTLEQILTGLFTQGPAPTPVHRYLAGIPELPLIIDVWYDDTMAKALAERGAGWCQIQGVSHPQSSGEWVQYFAADNSPTDAETAAKATTLLYKPMGTVSPKGNFLVSDSDYVEILTEIDIQTPIPDVVKHLRTGRNFLFLGCRFDGEIGRTFARQIIKRSTDKHWAVIEGELSKNEQRFLETYGIERIDLPLAEAVKVLSGA